MSFNAISQPTALPLGYTGNFLADTSTIHRLPNGNYAAILASRTTVVGPTSWHSVLLDSSGSPISALETIITNSTSVQAPPDNLLEVLPLSNGGYGVVYAQPFLNNTGQPIPVSGTAMVEWFNAAGVSQGAPQQIAGTPTPVEHLFVAYGGVKDIAVTYANGHSFVV